MSGVDILDQTIVKGKRLRLSSEEDKDMANCLILLARGCSQATHDDDAKPTAENTKFIRRKSAEMSTGVYVYECKTCSRTFPSFQALGGHRASHKKPKTTVVDTDPPIAAQLPNGILLSIENKSRIHECSICGSEFASGQALGGHMRRHRPVTKIRDDGIDSTSFRDEDKKRNMLALDLDLNLPAPPEDDHRREVEFHDRFSPANQQPRIVLSAAALVDCHY